MQTIYLTVLPGGLGERAVNFTPGTTLADLIVQEGLAGKTISVNGSLVEANFNMIELTHNSEIVATQSVKGN